MAISNDSNENSENGNEKRKRGNGESQSMANEKQCENGNVILSIKLITNNG